MRSRRLQGVVSRLLPVHDASQVGEARRASAAVAQEAELDDEIIGRLAIVVTEAATNLARHAREGRLLARCLTSSSRGTGVEVIAVDCGPGITDLPRALEDGYSTGGTSGSGLGAIRRQADEFDIYSQPGAGTVLVARLWARGTTPRARDATLVEGVVCLPHPSERACGDGWWVTHAGGRTSVLVVDGLGHGPSAAEASEIAIGVFRERQDEPAGMIHALHSAMRGTRGAALAVTEIDPVAGTLRFAGVGNISASLLAPLEKMSSMPSHSGIVGHQMRKVQEFSYAWTPASTLLMHSDGLATRWRIEQYPGLLAHDPSLLAAILHRDHARGRDDVTVLALRSGQGHPA